MSEKKAKKKKERLLLIPGSQGWEVWRGLPGEDLSLALRTQEEEALAIESLPSGEITMAFPVRDVSALPFKTPSTDEGLAEDLAEMHIERLGLRPSVLSGVLTDCYRVARTEEELLLLPVVLTPPEEGSMPKRSPSSFDLSPRCLPLPADAMVVWKEFGRWVFAVSRGSEPVHFQALADELLGEGAGREIRLSLLQLQMQGMLEGSGPRGVVWVEEEQPVPSEEALQAFARGFGGELTVAHKPAPFFSTQPCQLLPADIRAERVARKKRRQLIALVSVLVLGYLGLVGWGVVNLLNKEREAATVQAQAEELAPAVADLLEHRDKWAELEPLTEDQHFPVELLYRVAQASPRTGLKFDRAEFDNQTDISDQGTPQQKRRITLTGKAAALAQVNQFSEKLQGSRDLSYYKWTTPEAQETGSGEWRFVYDGVPKAEGPPN